MPQIIQGDALSELTKLESESVDCCITSPPYWALRDYKNANQIWDGKLDCDHDWVQEVTNQWAHTSPGSNNTLNKTIKFEVDYHNRVTYSDFCSKCNAWRGQHGLEPTIDLYINHLVSIFDQVKRVLKKTGSCWVVIGDTYSNWLSHYERYGGGYKNNSERTKQQYIPQDGVGRKSLCMIPERFAIQMIDHGWILRNKIIWYKPNCMPSSAKDRFTVDWEYVYFFTKSQKYFFETQYEPLQELKTDNAVKLGWNPDNESYTDWYFNKREKKSWHNHKNDLEMGFGQQKRGQKAPILSYPLGRIKRCVWKISTKPFSAQKLLADYVGADGKLYRASPDCPIHAHLASQRESDTRSYDEQLNSSGGKSDKCVCSSKIPDHFAVFPPDLVEPMLKAGCPEFICNKCGKPRKLEYEEIRIKTCVGTSNAKFATTDIHLNDPRKRRSATIRDAVDIIRMPKFGGNHASEYGPRQYSGKEWNPIIRRLKSMGADDNGNYEGQSTKDYESHGAQNASDTKRRILESVKKRANSELVMTDCGCNAGFHSGIVLDPFLGAGTVGLVALQQNKDFIGIELNPSYIEIARNRLLNCSLDLYQQKLR